jgi:hypothetical protein
MSVANEMQSLLQWRSLFMAWQVANCVTMNWEFNLRKVSFSARLEQIHLHVFLNHFKMIFPAHHNSIEILLGCGTASVESFESSFTFL